MISTLQDILALPRIEKGIAYKAVTVDNGKMYSLFAEGKFRLEYQLEQITKSNIGLIYCHSNLDCVHSYTKNINKVLKVEIYNYINRFFGFLSYKEDVLEVEYYLYNTPKLMEFYHTDIIMAESIKPLEVVYER